VFQRFVDSDALSRVESEHFLHQVKGFRVGVLEHAAVCVCVCVRGTGWSGCGVVRCGVVVCGEVLLWVVDDGIRWGICICMDTGIHSHTHTLSHTYEHTHSNSPEGNLGPRFELGDVLEGLGVVDELHVVCVCACGCVCVCVSEYM
jgi:hypothetical protein